MRTESASGNAMDGAAAAFDARIVCEVCSAAFDCRQALAVHLAAKHGQKRDIRHYIDTPWCPCCLRLFASRIRCIDHLAEKAPTCRFNVINSYDRLDPHVVIALDEEDRLQIIAGKNLDGRKRGILNQAAVQMHGPSLPIFGAVEGYRHPLGPSRRLLCRPDEVFVG